MPDGPEGSPKQSKTHLLSERCCHLGTQTMYVCCEESQLKSILDILVITSWQLVLLSKCWSDRQLFSRTKDLGLYQGRIQQELGGGGGRKDSTCLKSDISKSAFTDMPCFQFFAIVFHF